MKILMLTPYLPYPPASGGQIRTLNLLKYLSKDNEITLVSLYKNNQEKQFSSELKTYCKRIFVCKRPEKPWQIRNILKSVFSNLPFLIVRNYSTEAALVVKNLLARETFDVIHAETFYIMPHIPIDTKIPTLLVEQTIEFKVYQHFLTSLPFYIRYPLWLDILKLKFWEIFYWKKATLVATVSESDKNVIQNFVPQNQTYVIPNGAGDEMFVKILPKKELKAPKLLFVGNFSWLQNTEAAQYLIKQVFPTVLTNFPNAQLLIAGQTVTTKLTGNYGPSVKLIEIQGDDSTTIQSLYKDSTIFVAPIFGPGGTRLKILAAMAAGLPIITSKTGITGLDVGDKKHVMIATSAKSFADNVKELLTDAKLYEVLRANSYELVKQKYSWNQIAKELEKVYHYANRT